MRKKAVVLGLGMSGKSAMNFLKNKGYEVLGVDKENENQTMDFSHISLVVKSPGLLLTHPLVEAASAKNLIVDEIELGAKELMRRGKTLIAITGTNGKTTTTFLVAHILNVAGKKALACGNIGLPLTSVSYDADIYVVEISSFQLMFLKGELFDGGVLLNISHNHLDWHTNFTEYVEAKWSLVKRLKKGAPFFVSELLFHSHASSRISLLPKMEERVESLLSLVYREEGSKILKPEGENYRAAFALSSLFNISQDDFIKGCKTFKAPPHRMEVCENKKGVIGIDDSSATTIDAVLYSLDRIEKPVFLIVGGVHKGGDFKKWRDLFSQKVKKVFLIGSAAPLIQKALEGSVPIEVCNTLDRAVFEAEQRALEGDIILLSPGCSSFDEFKDYRQRGERFKKLILKEVMP
ncbi:MAG: UDP-N-acetylmuramoyl-L-alanine--D-glutamate ligase [Chlamydiia bacterium]|nr:UDP-N-acetylmuramoyl-L-alanine--D-glutamate ligase [Chlamydiia bacterium]